ncbi:MAG: polysaccharide biosynthesis C-terminal domain-containing protein [Ardenticatenaceae bacterium]|nr:polysaccharide biosynthesis C-terminal domain-containing protein [Ardenticatenaceae bacterium]
MYVPLVDSEQPFTPATITRHTANEVEARVAVEEPAWLILFALPVALLTTRYAGPIVLAFGGREFAEHGSTLALQILIWFLPFSFINSLVHYVLIAVNQQHALTRAFIIGVLFNLVANLLLIPRSSFYGAAAATTILSEIVLLLPFYALLRRHVGHIPWLSLFWRLIVALAAMALPLWPGGLPFWLAIPLAGLVYLAALVALGAFGPDDRAVLAQLLPGPARRALRLPAAM